jgi:hypothetical protein
MPEQADKAAEGGCRDGIIERVESVVGGGCFVAAGHGSGLLE